MDGQHSVKNIEKFLKDKFSLELIYYALLRLEKKGYIEEANFRLSREESAFWSFLSVNSDSVSQILRNSRISVTGVGKVKIDTFLEKLKRRGISLVEKSESQLHIEVVDDYLNPLINLNNQKAIEYQKPWLLIKPNGRELWIGPLFVPDEKGCYTCFRKGLERHQIEKSLLLSSNKAIFNSSVSAVSFLPETLDLAFNLAMLEIMKYLIAPRKSKLKKFILTLNSLNWKSQYHQLLDDESCEVCKKKSSEYHPYANLKDLKINLYSNINIFSEKKLFQKIKRYVSPITGIVSKLYSHNDGISFVYEAEHHWPVSEKSVDIIFSGDIKNFHHFSCGKGVTRKQAKISAICESIERYCGIFTGIELRKVSTFKTLEKAIHPNDCALYSCEQYQNRNWWNERNSTFNKVPYPFEEDVEVEWTPVWSLTNKDIRYLPTQLLFFGYHFYNHKKIWPKYCIADSNGNAAGEDLQNSILQGLFELIERDCVAIWWYNRLSRPQIDLKSFNEPYFYEIVKYYNTQNRQVWVLDITNDLEVPACVAISKQKEGSEELICMGFGCHVDVIIAIKRALTEMNQMWVVAKKKLNQRIGNPGNQSKELIHWLKNASIKDQTYLIPDNQWFPIQSTQLNHEFLGDNMLDYLLRILENKGLEILVLDQSRPGIDLKVVKVIVPGLRHFWARFAPGRLYHVPVKMQWVQQPLPEAKLNPISLFL